MRAAEIIPTLCQRPLIDSGRPAKPCDLARPEAGMIKGILRWVFQAIESKAPIGFQDSRGFHFGPVVGRFPKAVWMNGHCAGRRRRGGETWQLARADFGAMDSEPRLRAFRRDERAPTFSFKFSADID